MPGFVHSHACPSTARHAVNALQLPLHVQKLISHRFHDTSRSKEKKQLLVPVQLQLQVAAAAAAPVHRRLME